jgi:hypothetical protein
MCRLHEQQIIAALNHSGPEERGAPVRTSCYWTKVQLRPTLSGPTDFGISRGKIVRHRLRRIIECPELDASDRNRRFLQRVVDEMLAACAELSV